MLGALALALQLLLSFPLRAEPSEPPDASPRLAPSVAVTSLHQWLTDRMLSWMPPGRSYIPEAKETPEEGKARYEKIADAMISVVYDPSESPIFTGKYGRARTLALVASVSWFESGYRKDVDLGTGALGRGDNGKSWCMMQVMLGTPDPKIGGTKSRVFLTQDSFKVVQPNDSRWASAYGGEDLVQDRQKCFRTGLHLLRNSFRACRSLPVEDRLGVYGSGKCQAGWQPGRYRVQRAQRWLASVKPPLTDSEALSLLHPAPSSPDAPDQGEREVFRPAVLDSRVVMSSRY